MIKAVEICVTKQAPDETQVERASKFKGTSESDGQMFLSDQRT
jgi:hypothetical protein